MLSQQAWLTLAPDLAVEWQQCYDEGLDVADLETLCRTASKTPGFSEKGAGEIARLLHSRPMREGYPYSEPSDLPSILAACPETKPVLPAPDPASLPDKIRGAWLGRIAGCLLGKPVEGFRRDKLIPLLENTGNRPLRRYICWKDIPPELAAELELTRQPYWGDTLEDGAPNDDDTNYTVLALRLLETYGPDFTPNDVLESWLMWLPLFSTCTAERVAYRHAASGLLAPATATQDNPFREWIGAQIRADFFGYIHPGKPQKAAEMAYRDACVSHVKNGIYGEMMTAAMIAAAAVCCTPEDVLEAGLAVIPCHCRLRRDIDQVRQWHSAGLSAAQITENIHELYDEHKNHDWCLTTANAMIVAMALLCGGGDVGTSICLAVEAAFDTDCNGATVGSITGMLSGARSIEPSWTDPLQNCLHTALLGLSSVSIEDLVNRTLALVI